jgi:hypothetical protein
MIPLADMSASILEVFNVVCTNLIRGIVIAQDSSLITKNKKLLTNRFDKTCPTANSYKMLQGSILADRFHQNGKHRKHVDNRSQ